MLYVITISSYATFLELFAHFFPTLGFAWMFWGETDACKHRNDKLANVAPRLATEAAATPANLTHTAAVHLVQWDRY